MEALGNLVGTLLAGKYKIEALIGYGGMSAVFRARGPEGGPVAVKVLLPGRKRRGQQARFIREARLASAIRHPHVVTVFDYGRWGDESEKTYLTMEFIDGPPMSDLLDSSMPPSMAVGLACQILEALAHVHARNVLHRDVKPDNILIIRERSGRLCAKIADFGLAAALGEHGPRLTEEGSVLGTPHYVAPEQALGAHLRGPCLDLYPVGVILYRMLSGELPFDGPPAQALLGKVSNEAPALRPRAGLEVEHGVLAAVGKLLARQPEDRYAVAPDVLAALEPYAQDPVLSNEAWFNPGVRTRTITFLPGGPSADDESATLAWGDTIVENHVQVARRHGERQLWGREDELAELQSIAEEVEGGVGRVVVIRGEPGMGKSSLMWALAIDMAERGRFTVLRAAYQAAAGASVGIRGALDQMLGTVGRGAGRVEQAVREFLRRHKDEDEREVRDLVAFLRPEVAAPGRGGREQQLAGFALVVRVLRRLAVERPVLLELDDLHGGGPDAAAFLEFLLFESGFEPFPVMLIATARDGVADQRFEAALQTSDRYEGHSRRTKALGPLEPEALAECLMEQDGLDAETANRAAVRAGGNPLFAQHLIRAGTLNRQTRKHVAVTDSGETLPPALRRILEASLAERLSHADDAERLNKLLTHIAVLGARVSAALLEQFVAAEADIAERFDDDVDALIENGVLAETGQADAIAFSTELLREVLLERIGPRRARRYQRRAAEVRIAWAGERTGAEAIAIARHFESAGMDSDAATWWLTAFTREVAAGNTARAADAGLRALDFMGSPDGRRPEHTIAVGRLLREIGRLDVAVGVLAPVVDDPDHDLAVRAGETLAAIHQERADGEAWGDIVARLEERRGSAGSVGKAACDRARAFWLNHQGRYGEARAAALSAVSRSGAGEDTVSAAIRMCWACLYSEDLDAALAAAERAERSAGDRSALRAEALRMRAIVAIARDDWESAITLCTEALALHRRAGRATLIARTLADLGWALQVGEKLDDARDHFARAIKMNVELGLNQEQKRAEFYDLFCRIQGGDYDGVAAELEAALEMLERGGLKGFVPLIRLAISCAYVMTGRPDEATAALAESGVLTGAAVQFTHFWLLEHAGHAFAEASATEGAGPELGQIAAELLETAAETYERTGRTRRALRCRTRLIEIPRRESA